jgi:hypothetical protein
LLAEEKMKGWMEPGFLSFDWYLKDLKKWLLAKEEKKLFIETWVPQLTGIYVNDLKK